MSCQAAIPLGRAGRQHGAGRIAGSRARRRSTRRSPASASAWAAARGTIQLARTDDTAAAALHRRPRRGASVKEAVCKGTISFLRREARKPGSLLLAQGRQAAEQTAAVPTAGDAPADRRTRRTIHAAAAAAVHDRLRDPGLGNRIRRRAAGQLPALGRGGPGDGARHQGLPRPARHPAGAQRAAGAGPPARGLRRPVAARTAAARRHATRRPMWCSPNRCRWRCWWCWRR